MRNHAERVCGALRKAPKNPALPASYISPAQRLLAERRRRARRYGRSVSPTVFREGPFRFFFFSREEARVHVHVSSAQGEAKFWVEPRIELARSHGLSDRDLARAEKMVEDHEQEIRDAWIRHFHS